MSTAIGSFNISLEIRDFMPYMEIFLYASWNRKVNIPTFGYTNTETKSKSKWLPMDAWKET
jgi:hypothetical protein